MAVARLEGRDSITAPPIYVEIQIRGTVDEVWRLTQVPELHGRWDLRFTSITYLPRSSESQSQRFRYATRLGFGVEIEGWGETVGERTADGTRASALRFGSQDRRSLIRSGSGYWKYEQIEEGVRFITGYDYQVRWGIAGRTFDRLVFRPLMGWATAWSFDSLRIWVEEGADPQRLRRQTLIHSLAAATVAFVWIWHGIVPKLAGPHPDELAMLLDAGLQEYWLRAAAQTIGGAEVALGIAVLLFARRRWPWLLTILLMAAATVGVLATSPRWALAAFNPITLNLLLAVVATIGLLTLRGLPSARRCLRRAPEKLSVEPGS